jgi:hypothetical protein
MASMPNNPQFSEKALQQAYEGSISLEPGHGIQSNHPIATWGWFKRSCIANNHRANIFLIREIV